MSDVIRCGLFIPLQGLLHYSLLIERTLLVVCLGLLLVWGAYLLSLLRRSEQPRVLARRWCREWVSPVLIIGAGLALMGREGDVGVGHWLEVAGVGVTRFVMDLPSPAGPLISEGVAVDPVRLRCPGTYAGMEVQGCTQ